MAETPQVCRYLHLPVQSGSDRILAAMNRSYTQRALPGPRGPAARTAMPDLALSGDIIVGFPGETEEDFEETMDVVDAADYDQLFTFVYSPARGHARGARCPAGCRARSVQERFDRLVERVQRRRSRTT